MRFTNEIGYFLPRVTHRPLPAARLPRPLHLYTLML
jgi:hypothetical protein